MRRGRGTRAVRWALAGACVMTGAAFAVSHWWTAYFRISTGYAAGISAGGLWLGHYAEPSRFERLPIRTPVFDRNTYPKRWWFSAEDNRTFRCMVVPLWAPAVVLAVPVVWPFARAWRRRAAGRCVSCGYSLSGLAERTDGASPVCPECGAAAS